MNLLVELLQCLIFLLLALLAAAMLPGIIGCLLLALAQPAKRKERIIQSGVFFVSGLSATMLIGGLFNGGRLGAWPYGRQQLRNCQANLEHLVVAIDLYASDNQGHCPASLDKLAPQYLARLPICPAAGVDSYSASLDIKPNWRKPKSPLLKGATVDRFTLCCKGKHHSNAYSPADYPAYSSERGFYDPSRP